MALATLDGVLAGGVARRRLNDHREPALVRLGEHLDARVDCVVGALHLGRQVACGFRGVAKADF